MLSNFLIFLSFQSFLLTGEPFVMHPQVHSGLADRHKTQISQSKYNNKRQVFFKINLEDEQGLVFKSNNSFQKLGDLCIFLVLSWNLLPGVSNAANIAIMDTSIDMEHPSIARNFHHKNCLPNDLQQYCPVDAKQNIDLIDNRPYSMNSSY